MRRLRSLALPVLLTSSSLLGCAGASEPQQSTTPTAQANANTAEPSTPLAGRDPTPGEARALSTAMATAEQLRGVRFQRDVPVRVQTRAEITAFINTQVDDAELAEAATFYVAIGLLDPSVDVRALLLSVMGEQIIGLYDTDAHAMIVREDVLSELAQVIANGGEVLSVQNAMVLVHEYVHALQDQRLGLDVAREVRDARSIDEANAYASLVEGDATLTMLATNMPRGRSLTDLTRTPGLLRSLVAQNAGQSSGTELASAPPIIRVPLLSRYMDGLVYVGARHGHGGFSAINSAFRSPPRTTEQVLHPEASLAMIPVAAMNTPMRIELPAMPQMEAAGWTALDEETLGELELSVFFARGTNTDRNEAAAAGWNGDRIRVYEQHVEGGNHTAFLWYLDWDTEADAIEAEQAATRIGGMNVRREGTRLMLDRGLLPN